MEISPAGDAIRPFLLDAYGGLYMDVDVECFDATDDMVDGFDLVLQLEDNGNKSLNNAVMAGAPGLDIWSSMQHLLKDRWHPTAPTLASNSDMRTQAFERRCLHLGASAHLLKGQSSTAGAISAKLWLLWDAFGTFTRGSEELPASLAAQASQPDVILRLLAKSSGYLLGITNLPVR